MIGDRIEFSANPDGNIRVERYLAGVKSTRINFDGTQLRAKDATKDWAIEANRLLNQPNADPLPPVIIKPFVPNSVFDRLKYCDDYAGTLFEEGSYDAFSPKLNGKSFEELLTDAVKRAEANVKTTDMPTL